MLCLYFGCVEYVDYFGFVFEVDECYFLGCGGLLLMSYCVGD